VPGGVQGNDGENREHPEHVDSLQTGHADDLNRAAGNMPVETCTGKDEVKDCLEIVRPD
jgi:hypothetical protein